MPGNESLWGSRARPGGPQQLHLEAGRGSEALTNLRKRNWTSHPRNQNCDGFWRRVVGWGKKEIMEGKPGDREAPHARSCTRKAGKPEAFLIFSGMPGNPEARGPG